MVKQKCITEEMVLDYLNDRLSDNHRNKIENHILVCESCLDLMLLARELIENPSAIDQLENVPECVTEKTLKKTVAERWLH